MTVEASSRSTRSRRVASLAARGGLVALLLSTFAVAGCVPIEPPEVSTAVDVEFRVVDGEQPLADATLLAVPVRAENDLGWWIPYASGTTDPQGRAWLRNEAGEAGLLPGDYDLWIVEPPRREAPDLEVGTIRYSVQRITVVSKRSTHRIDAFHRPIRELEGVAISSGRWAADLNDPPSSPLPERTLGPG